jgi:hypothetical protein
MKNRSRANNDNNLNENKRNFSQIAQRNKANRELNNTNESYNTQLTTEYICNNCINKDLISNKQYLGNPKLFPNSNDQNNFQDKLKHFYQQKIENEIKTRQINSEKVASNFFHRSTSKDVLINNNEKEENFLNKSNIDPRQLKLKSKNRAREEMINKNSNLYLQNKPEVDIYYSKYVENYTPNEKAERSRYITQHQLSKILEKQIKDQQLKDEMEHYQNKTFYKKQNSILRRQEEQDEKQKKMKEDGIKDNLMSYNEYKIRENEEKKRNAREKELREEREKFEKMQKEDEKTMKKKELEKKYKNKELISYIQNQINNKNRKDFQSRFPEESMTSLFMCEHGMSKFPCALCNREFPKNQLTKKKDYQSLAKLKNVKKKNI